MNIDLYAINIADHPTIYYVYGTFNQIVATCLQITQITIFYYFFSTLSTLLY